MGSGQSISEIYGGKEGPSPSKMGEDQTKAVSQDQKDLVT